MSAHQVINCDLGALLLDTVAGILDGTTANDGFQSLFFLSFGATAPAAAFGPFSMVYLFKREVVVSR